MGAVLEAQLVCGGVHGDAEIGAVDLLLADEAAGIARSREERVDLARVHQQVVAAHPAQVQHVPCARELHRQARRACTLALRVGLVAPPRCCWLVLALALALVFAHHSVLK